MGKKTVGFYGGKFVPFPHIGHVYAMIEASTYVDELYVIVMYDTEYEKGIFKDSKVGHETYTRRLRWWKQITKNMGNVTVSAIYDKQTGKDTDWDNGAKLVKEYIKKPIDYIFSSEEGYDTHFRRLYPNTKHIIIDSPRKRNNVSGTQIRTEGVIKHWENIPNEVKPYYVKKVVVVGSESCGKSTLVSNLAKVYNTRYVEEIGRTFYERIGSYETLPEDFHEIAYEHQVKIKEETTISNKVLFIDTESIVTQNLSIGYENQRLGVLDEIAKLQNYDLWLFLEDDVDWVDDGTRIFGEDNVRTKMTLQLKQLLNERNIEYKTIKGNYNKRLKESIKEVDKLMNE